jgi:hypothetical protein
LSDMGGFALLCIAFNSSSCWLHGHFQRIHVCLTYCPVRPLECPVVDRQAATLPDKG